MANITVRKNGGAPAARTDWEPGRWARELFGWDPFKEMMPSFSTGDAMAFAPAFEVKETKEGYVFKADLPGVEEKNVEITRTGNRLTVSGKREASHEDKGDTWYACERSYGSFARSFTLPNGIDGDHTRAELKDGVLTVVVPKTPEAQPKKVALNPATEKKS